MTIEPMKERFKRRYGFKEYGEIQFDDDMTERGLSGRKVKRMVSYKPHSHPGGRKPAWRSLRRKQRLFSRQ